jgi:hypothetical protein
MSGKNKESKIAVLGAGIMGCCLALELVQRGYRVDLVDGASTPITGASLHNEGKLHLGFVYANDPLKKTHGLMIKGSLAFSRIIEKLTGYDASALIPSRPFHYFIPITSHLDINTIHDHFHAVNETIHEMTRRSGDLYLDRRFSRYFQRNASHVHESLFSREITHGSFRTEERSISPITVAKILRRAIKNQPAIHFIGNTRILSAEKLTNGQVAIESCRNGKLALSRYACVANCLWADRTRIDRTAGINDHGPWIWRYKVAIKVDALKKGPTGIPSATGILGAFGDVVNHDNGTYYVSWYPLCRIAQSSEPDGKKLNDCSHRGIFSRGIKKIVSCIPSASKFVASMSHQMFIRDNIREMSAYIPSLADLPVSWRKCELGGGIIMARGSTDIDDPNSVLHQRWAIGPVAHGSYVTVDTGKYCMAPLFAEETADMIKNIMG